MEPFLLLGLLVAGGYVLGVIGFFRANTAHTELRSVRRALAELASRQAAVGASQASAAGSPDIAAESATNQLLDPRGVPATPGPPVPAIPVDPLWPALPPPPEGPPSLVRYPTGVRQPASNDSGTSSRSRGRTGRYTKAAIGSGGIG